MVEIAGAASGRSARNPLSVRWHDHTLPPLRAGTDVTAAVTLENTGSAPWRSTETGGIRLSYHWLDAQGNAIVWDGRRLLFERVVHPGETVRSAPLIRVPMPPGDYRLEFDLVEEHRFWLSDYGCGTLELDVTVLPRIGERRLAVRIHDGPGDDAITRAALSAQDEPIVTSDAVATAHLVAGCVPARDWSSRILDAHSEGFAAVGGSIVPETGLWQRRRWKHLAASAPGGGRNPRFPGPLLLPSLVTGLAPTDVDGWPAFAQPQDREDDRQPTLFDGRIEVRLRPRSDRRPG